MRRASSAIAAAVSMLLAVDAHAEDASKERDRATFHPVALSVNPIAWHIGFFSVSFEAMPARHHGLIFTPTYIDTQHGIPISLVIGALDWKGGGTELGYRYYTGSRGPNGFFAGITGGWLRVIDTPTSMGLVGPAPRWTGWTTSFELGGQHITPNHFIVGGGVGVMYWATTSADNPRFVTPRLLFDLGYAW
jgi:hypothetical protein